MAPSSVARCDQSPKKSSSSSNHTGTRKKNRSSQSRLSSSGRLDKRLDSIAPEKKARVQLALNAYFELNELERFVLDSKMLELQLLKRPATPVNVDKRLLLSTEVSEGGEATAEDDARKEEQDRLKTLLQDENILKSLGIGGSGGAAEKDAQAAKKEVVEEKKVEVKTAFDVELTAFAPESKVKVIKEVKDLFKLGLKEVRWSHAGEGPGREGAGRREGWSQQRRGGEAPGEAGRARLQSGSQITNSTPTANKSFVRSVVWCHDESY